MIFICNVYECSLCLEINIHIHKARIYRGQSLQVQNWRLFHHLEETNRRTGTEEKINFSIFDAFAQIATGIFSFYLKAEPSRYNEGPIEGSPSKENLHRSACS